MKPQPNLTNLFALLALLLLTCCPPWRLQAAEAEPQQSATASPAPSEQAPRPAPNCPAAYPPTADGQQTQQADSVQDNEDDLQTLRQRYRHDPTGVRARLGMCRRGQGGGHGPHGGRHGGGQQRRQRWVEPWNAP